VENGVKVTPLVDHHFVKSIYFFDPKGLRLEVNARTEPPQYLSEAAAAARPALDEWTRSKRAPLGS
jgi:hypothetical protein